MTVASPPAHDSRRRTFRIAIVAASVVAAVVGSVFLAMRDSGEKVTTRGVIATLAVPGHPGPVAAGPDALWLGLGEATKPVADRPLLRFDLATPDTVAQTVRLGGQASHLAHVGSRLIASVEHVGGEGSGPSFVIALDWRSGRVLLRRQFAGLVGPLAETGDALWVLQVRPAALLQLDRLTLTPTADALPLSSGRGHGLAAGAGYLWAAVADPGEVLRIDPATRAITRRRVGGSPVGILVAGGSVWLADREHGAVVRLEPRTLRAVGEPIHVGAEPSWLGAAGRYLFVGDAGLGTAARIDMRSGRQVGSSIRFAQPAKGATIAIAPAGRSIWVSSFASNTLTRISSTGVTAPAPSGTASSAQETATVARELPPGGKVVAEIAVPPGGGGFAVGEGAVWSMSSATATLLRIDPERNAVVARIDVHAGDTAGAGEGAVWLTYPPENAVFRIDPKTNTLSATIPVGPQPDGIAFSPGAVWIANAGGPSVTRIDPATNRIVATIRVGPKRACCSEHMGLLAAGGVIWATVPNGDRIVRIDPVTNTVTGTVNLSYPPCGGMVVVENAMWSAGGGCGDLVAHIDLRTKKITGQLDEAHPVGLAFAAGTVWIAVLDTGTVDQIDARTGRLVARLKVGGIPIRLGVGFGSVWVNDNDGRVVRIEPQR